MSSFNVLVYDDEIDVAKRLAGQIEEASTAGLTCNLKARKTSVNCLNCYINVGRNLIAALNAIKLTRLT